MYVSRNYSLVIVAITLVSFLSYAVTMAKTSQASQQVNCISNAQSDLALQPQFKLRNDGLILKGYNIVSLHNFVVVDLGQDGFHFSTVKAGINIDLKDIIGTSKLNGWVAKDGNDAFLVQDLNGNGVVDCATELFGQGSQHETLDNIAAPSGFYDLAQYDDVLLGGNGDGLISENDRVWERLAYWVDTNAGGKSTEDEMFSTMDIGITHFNTHLISFHKHKLRSMTGYHAAWSIFSYKKDCKKVSEYKVISVFFKRFYDNPLTIP